MGSVELTLYFCIKRTMLQPKREKRIETAGRAHESSAPVRRLRSRDNDIVHVRRVVAGNPSSPLSVLSRLSEDDSELVRRSVACNPKTPAELLAKLAGDESAEVRLAVAENQKTSHSVLEKLAGDVSVDVRFGVAENPHLPERLLLLLARDENPYVRCRALKTLRMLSPESQSRVILYLEAQFEGLSWQ